MFKHSEYIVKEDYPFNAGYVVYANYFFPASVTGEASDTPTKEFPKAFKQNFEYFVDNELDEKERSAIYKSFKDKKSINEISNEMGISIKEFTALRTKAFAKLKSYNRMRSILSDVPYVPKQDKRYNITVGDILVESVLKCPDSVIGGGKYRLITVKNGKTPVFSMRMSTKTNNMSDEELHDMLVSIAKIASTIKVDDV